MTGHEREDLQAWRIGGVEECVGVWGRAGRSAQTGRDKEGEETGSHVEHGQQGWDMRSGINKAVSLEGREQVGPGGM